MQARSPARELLLQLAADSKPNLPCKHHRYTVMPPIQRSSVKFIHQRLAMMGCLPKHCCPVCVEPAATSTHKATGAACSRLCHKLSALSHRDFKLKPQCNRPHPGVKPGVVVQACQTGQYRLHQPSPRHHGLGHCNGHRYPYSHNPQAASVLHGSVKLAHRLAASFAQLPLQRLDRPLVRILDSPCGCIQEQQPPAVKLSNRTCGPVP